MTEHSKGVEIDVGDDLRGLMFSANGEYLVSGHLYDGVRVWRGKRCVATMKAEDVNCVGVSKGGQWIAAGTWNGKVYVWNAHTYERAFKLKHIWVIHGVDFSPDSTRLVSASANRTATVWNINTRKEEQTLHHEDWVLAAKYSPQGDRIATATPNHVRVWDSNDGSLLVNVQVRVASWFNNGLAWSNDRLFVISEHAIKELDASTGSAVSQWQVPDIDITSCIALPKHGKFLAYATKRTVTFWDTLSRSMIAQIQIQRPEYMRSVAISPDDLSLAIREERRKVVIHSLSRIINSIPPLCLHPALQVPAVQVEVTALDAWHHDQLGCAETLLDAVMATSSNQRHHTLAIRALIRARLTRFDVALADAEESINIQPSVIGYIANSIAHVGNGDRNKACRSCDIAIQRFHSDHVTFLLLVKSIVLFVAGEHLDAISRVGDLIAVNPLLSVLYVIQAHMLLLRGNILLECGNYEDAIRSFERARCQLRPYLPQSLFLISLASSHSIFGWKFNNLDITIRQRMCEALYLAGHATTAGESLLELVYTFKNEVYTTESIVKWVSDFTQRYLTAIGSDTTSNAPCNSDNSALDASLLSEWVRATLASRSWRDAFVAAVRFIIPKFTVYQAICERLEAIERVTDATECTLKMAGEISRESDVQAKWIVDIKNWLNDKLEEYGDAAMNARRYNEAIVLYSAGLSLDYGTPLGLFAKRSKAHTSMGLWKDALDDAIQVTMLDPTLSIGYERKYAALRGAGCYGAAEVAFETMLSKMSESPDAATRERACQYVSPAETENAIREAVREAIRLSPPVLISTDSGRLLDRPGQASLFESQPIFHELVSSTTTQIDHPLIRDEVEHYYRYAMFSHKWKENEPSYDDVIRLVVFELSKSPTHDKLQKCCETAREAGLHWAWSDTCCINRSDTPVLQEALVSMFQWYQNSTLTIVLLCDVPLRCLFDSVWNSRAWTFQEYHASKVVRFYNKDWTLYKNIDIPNHKESSEIVAEMEEATGISAQALMALRPGLEDIREKLRLASTRQSTRVEDEAYSLLGIFSLSMSIEYGEGDRALGRLLAQLLASSGDTSILAWTGQSGGFNSCLPAQIAVFSQSVNSYIPRAMTSTEMDTATTRLRETSVDLTLLVRLYGRLNELPEPRFSGKRMRLPSMVFKLGPLSESRSGSEHVFRAQTNALGVVEIKTDEDLSHFKSLVLVHPWIDFLLDKQPVGGVIDTVLEGQHPGSVVETIPEEGTNDQSEPSWFPDPGPGDTPATPKTETWPFFPLLFRGWSAARPREATRPASDARSLRPPSTLLEMDREMGALRFLVRLKQPFGALLLTPDPRNVSAYRRVATGTLITVQVVEEMTPTTLDKLIRSVEVLGVL